MSVERNERALVALIDKAAERQRREVTGAALGDARQLVRAAHTEARASMRRAFEDERRLERQRVGAAQANLDTRRRLAMQRRNAALVAAAWRLFPEALLRRWHDASGRRRWTDRIVEAACIALPRATWQVVHPSDWSTEERRQVAARVEQQTDRAPEFVSDAALRGGLRITADGTSVDGTIEALLADRSDLAARVLHRFANPAKTTASDLS